MRRTILQYLAAIVFTASVGGAMLSLAAPQTALAAKQPGDKCSERLLTFPTWFRGLTDKDCNIKAPTGDKNGLSNFIWKIALNIIEIVLQLIGYIAVAFVIFGGYRYMLSAGSPDGMVKARKTITNALIGLVISIFSIAIVNIVAGAVK